MQNIDFRLKKEKIDQTETPPKKNKKKNPINQPKETPLQKPNQPTKNLQTNKKQTALWYLKHIQRLAWNFITSRIVINTSLKHVHIYLRI